MKYRSELPTLTGRDAIRSTGQGPALFEGAGWRETPANNSMQLTALRAAADAER